MKTTIKQLKETIDKLTSELENVRTLNNALIDENKELKTTNDNLTQQLNNNVEQGKIDKLAFKLNRLLLMPKFGASEINLIWGNIDYNLEQTLEKDINMNKIINKLYIDVANAIKTTEAQLEEMENENNIRI